MMIDVMLMCRSELRLSRKEKGSGIARMRTSARNPAY